VGTVFEQMNVIQATDAQNKSDQLFTVDRP
jgi:hypothetical protein